MLDPWVVHGYKSLSCNNFLNPSQFYQQGAFFCQKQLGTLYYIWPPPLLNSALPIVHELLLFNVFKIIFGILGREKQANKIEISNLLVHFMCPARLTNRFLISDGHFTVFENHRKSLIQHCERSELRLHFEWTKVN